MSFDRNTMKHLLFLITFTVLLLLGIQHFNTVMEYIHFFIRLFLPFIVGTCMAFILNLPMRFLERSIFPKIPSKLLHKFHRPIALSLSLLFIVSIVGTVGLLILPEFIDRLSLLVNTFGTFIEKFGQIISSSSKEHSFISAWLGELDLNWSEIGKAGTDYIQSFLHTLFSSTFSIVSTIMNGMMNFMISFMFAMYILSRKEQLSSQAQQLLFAYVKKEWAIKVYHLFTLINKTFSNFITGQCLESLIQFFVFYLLLTVLKFDYALLISIFIAFMSFIPIIGSYISSYTSAFLLFMVSPWKAFLFLLLFMVVQQLDSTFIYPKIVGNSVGLPPMWVIVAVTVGGRLLGIVGMVTFIPLCSILYTLLKKDAKQRLKEKEIDISKVI